jgi:hypothetical protein
VHPATLYLGKYTLSGSIPSANFIWSKTRFLDPIKLGLYVDHENLLEMLLSCWLDIFLYSVCACMERDIEIFLRKNPINLIIIIRLSKKSCYMTQCEDARLL